MSVPEIADTWVEGKGYLVTGTGASRLLRLLQHGHDRLDALHAEPALRIADVQLQPVRRQLAVTQ